MLAATVPDKLSTTQEVQIDSSSLIAAFLAAAGFHDLADRTCCAAVVGKGLFLIY